MSHATLKVVIITVLAVGIGLLAWGASIRAASGAEVPAVAGLQVSTECQPESDEPTATPAPTPASAAVVRRALKKRVAAVTAWREWNRARSALSMRVVYFQRHSDRRPVRSESRARWVAAARGWRLDKRSYQVRTAKLVYRMKNPGGSSSGVRWLPLARWIGWPSSTWSMLASVITRESRGRECASNGGVYLGLLQIWRQHVSDCWRLLTAEYNLRVGLRLWRESRWGPWAQTAF